MHSPRPFFVVPKPRRPRRQNLLAFSQAAAVKKDVPVKPDPPKQEFSLMENAVAGACSRMVAQTALHPIDVMKTRIQAKGVVTQFRNMSDVGRIFVKGITPCILLAVPAGIVQFVSYEMLKKKATEALPKNRSGQIVAQLIAGAGGAFIAGSIRVPQEILRQRVQAEIYPNAVVCFKEIMKKDGPAGFYTGFRATQLRDVPQTMIAFMLFEQFKGAFEGVTKRKPTNVENLMLGSAAGAVSAWTTTPLDVVKTRIMTQRATEAMPYKGIVDVFVRVCKEEGPTTLFRGAVARVAYVAPLNAIMFAVFEGVRSQMIKFKRSSSGPGSDKVASNTSTTTRAGPVRRPRSQSRGSAVMASSTQSRSFAFNSTKVSTGRSLAFMYCPHVPLRS